MQFRVCMPLLFSLAVVMFWITCSAGVYISNLSEACYRCLCHVSTQCAITHECTGGYCGPYNISRVYWIDAGRPTMPEDDAERNHAWSDCARSYHCAKKIIEGYLMKFGKESSTQPLALVAYLNRSRLKTSAAGYCFAIPEAYAEDCNGDGVTNCYDYMMINGNGGYGCTQPLNRSANGRRWLERYEQCGIILNTS